MKTIHKVAEYYTWPEPQFKNPRKRKKKRQHTINKSAEFYEKDILCSIDHFIALVRF